MSLCLFLRSFSAIWVLLHHLTWQCNNKRQGRTESLDRPSELLKISSKFHAKKQTHLHFTPPNPQSDALRSPFSLQSVPVNLASGSHNSTEKINYSSKNGAIYPWLVSERVPGLKAYITTYIVSKTLLFSRPDKQQDSAWNRQQTEWNRVHKWLPNLICNNRPMVQCH